MHARCRAFARPLARLALLLALGCVGCASAKPNPSFAVSSDDARRALGEMRSNPKQLDRPLVVLSGFCDPGIASSHLRSEFRRLTGDDRVIGVSFLFCGDFDACRRQVIAAVDKAFPSDDPLWTTEVDVVGVSMGGLVGRYAAVPTLNQPEGRRLRVARLFTISTPHRGAALAGLPTIDRLQIDMRAGSRFLRDLDAAYEGGGYELFPYVRLSDVPVGPPNAAPRGRTAWWVSNLPLQDSHMGAPTDPRIVADIARRLRGEAPFTTDPPAPLPGARRREVIVARYGSNAPMAEPSLAPPPPPPPPAVVVEESAPVASPADVASAEAGSREVATSEAAPQAVVPSVDQRPLHAIPWEELLNGGRGESGVNRADANDTARDSDSDPTADRVEVDQRPSPYAM